MATRIHPVCLFWMDVGIFVSRVAGENISNPVEEPSTRRKMEHSHFVLEWRIENFSCWMEGAHGKAIVCRQPSMVVEPAQIELSLYPNIRGYLNPMEMTFAGPNILFREEGNLTFLAPDGSILCTRRVNEGLVRDLHRVVGPRFKDVVSRIEQIEDLHGDHLTIQFKCRNPQGHRIHMTTTLDVLDTSWKIKQPIAFLGESVTIASISYNGKNAGDQRMLVRYLTVEKSISLKTNPVFCSGNSERPSVQYCLSIFDSNDVLVDHSKAVLNFCSPPNTASVSVSSLESSGHCVLRLKIVNGNSRSHCRDFFPSTSPFKIAPVQEIGVGESPLPLSEDLRSLYQGREFSDFGLKCGDVTFPVHRSILCARSPVFKTMLSSNMKEAASGSADIADLDPASLDLFLVFLYTGSFKEVACDSALKLYYAADKYQVPSLVKECADCLCANLRLSNVCEVLDLGDRHGDEQLTSAAQNFILRNFKEVTRSTEWRDYMNRNPQLLVKTLTHFAANGFVGYICS